MESRTLSRIHTTAIKILSAPSFLRIARRRIERLACSKEIAENLSLSAAVKAVLFPSLSR